jgi:homoserine O-acetyltransferase
MVAPHPHQAGRMSVSPRLIPCTEGVLGATLALRQAGVQRVNLRFRLVGAVNGPVHAVLGGISATRHVVAVREDEPAGWWQAQVGTDHAFDLEHVQVLSFDWIGRDGTLDAPISTADQADALAVLLDHLGIRRLASIVGSSYGAMVGLAFAERHPALIERLVAISGGDRADPYAAAWRALQRRVLDLGRDGVEAVALARQFAMLSYRTPEEFAARFDAEPTWDGDRLRCSAEDYLDAAGSRFAALFSPIAFRRLSESIDQHRVDPRRIKTPTTVIAVEQDRLVPVADLRRLAQTLAGPSRLELVQSIYGHDAFLKEPEQIGRLLIAALNPALSTKPLPAITALAGSTPALDMTIGVPTPRTASTLSLLALV